MIGEKNQPLAVLVHEIFLDCLYKDGEPHDDAIVVDGIVSRFGLNPDRLAKHAPKVRDVLLEMPMQFHPTADGGGDGWSFLQLCVDKNGEQWAEHPTMEQLICLGIALKMVRYLLPREVWEALPGGVPYIAINVNGFPPETQ